MGPEIGEEAKIRFRTLRNNVDNVYLIHDHEATQMYISRTDKGFDYYTAKISLGEKECRYYFEIHSGQLTCYYHKLGVCLEPQEENAFVIFCICKSFVPSIRYLVFPEKVYAC